MIQVTSENMNSLRDFKIVDFNLTDRRMIIEINVGSAFTNFQDLFQSVKGRTLHSKNLGSLMTKMFGS